MRKGDVFWNSEPPSTSENKGGTPVPELGILCLNNLLGRVGSITGVPKNIEIPTGPFKLGRRLVSKVGHLQQPFQFQSAEGASGAICVLGLTSVLVGSSFAMDSSVANMQNKKSLRVGESLILMSCEARSSYL